MSATPPRGHLAPPAAGASLLHPVALAAIAVLVLNDHVLKAAFPGVITGKLSDFAGLLFFPLFLVAGVEIAQAAAGRPWRGSDRALGAAALATAVVFALVKLDTPVTDLYRWGLGALQWPWHALRAAVAGRAAPDLAPVVVWTDPTDLVALPAVLAARWIGRTQRRAIRAATTSTAAGVIPGSRRI